MSEELNDKIKELYDDVMYYPNKVLEIFNDYFGEDRVDMQEFVEFKDFQKTLCTLPLRSFFPSENFIFKNINSEEADIIKDVISKNKDFLDYPVTTNEELVKHLLPRMKKVVFHNMQSGFILVHFPHVRVTNEHDRYVDINHLWVKVELKYNGAGTGFFSMNRSEYELSHMRAEYMHSHVPGIPFNDFSKFKTPCLGNGPIKNTVATLAIDYDEAMWRLFCLELDRYVGIESLSGIPHRYLENIGTGGTLVPAPSTFSMRSITFTDYNDVFSRENMRDLVRYLIRSKRLKFNFINGSYGLAMSYVEFIILVSNIFIEWYNKEFNLKRVTSKYDQLLSREILKECIIKDGIIKYFGIRYNGRDCMSYEGKQVCTFKGNPITVHITNNHSDTINKTVTINPRIAEEIAKAILTIVNYKYGREEERDEAGISTPACYV